MRDVGEADRFEDAATAAGGEDDGRVVAHFCGFDLS